MTFSNKAMYDWLSQLRRDFHMHPEIALREFRTTSKINEILTRTGVKLQKLPDMDTGAVGVIEGQANGKILALRADIDALPLSELNNVPYKSTVEGVMHACGHDAHTTILLGVAKKNHESNLFGSIKGQLKLIFQPAEEIVAGARKMIEAGALQNPQVDRLIAAHVNPDLEVGQAGLTKGPSHAAADFFQLTIQGKGGHAARPNETIDPIVAGAYFVNSVQTIITRNLNPLHPVVITVGKFQAGSTGNIIPNEAVLEGTIRTFNNESRSLAIKRIEEITSGLEKTFQVQAELNLKEGVPACVNNEEVVDDLFAAAAKVLGEKNVHFIEPSMGGEDLALFYQIIPGAVIRLGCSNHKRGYTGTLHSPDLDIDEEVLPIGVEIFIEAVKSYLT